jgi:hypothetical protein
MRTTALAAMLITGLLVLAPSLPADWQDQAPKAGLVNQLEAVYPLTVMDGIKVLKPGAVLVVQQDGILANPTKIGPTKIGPFRNRYANGQVTPEGRDLLRQLDPTRGSWGLGSSMQPRLLVAGEKVYLLKMEVKDDGITLTVQTCGGCDPTAADPNHKPYLASIQFSFAKGFVTATDSNHVQAAINPLLAVIYTPAAAKARPVDQRAAAPAYPQTQTPDGEPATQPVKFAELPVPPPLVETAPQTAPPTLRRASEVQPQAQTGVDESAAQPVKFADLTPPERPVETRPEVRPQVMPEVKTEASPETKPEINIGWTPDQVVAALGKPYKTDKRNRGQETYVYEQYGHMTITFEKGKVVAVESSR